MHDIQKSIDALTRERNRCARQVADFDAAILILEASKAALPHRLPPTKEEIAAIIALEMLLFSETSITAHVAGQIVRKKLPDFLNNMEAVKSYLREELQGDTRTMYGVLRRYETATISYQTVGWFLESLT